MSGELERIQQDFVSTVSHELRTPLAAIKGAVELMLGGVTGELPPEAREMLRIVQSNTERLAGMVNDLLDVARIEESPIDLCLDRRQLMDVVESAVLAIRPMASARCIRVDWELPAAAPLVEIDRGRMEQVLANLLSNSVKYNEPGGHVIVRSYWNDQWIVVDVEDTGHGIPEEFKPRLFRKFQRSPESVRCGAQGSGLGLSIARAIVEGHGGTISAQSVPGQGSTFSFCLPL